MGTAINAYPTAEFKINGNVLDVNQNPVVQANFAPPGSITRVVYNKANEAYLPPVPLDRTACIIPEPTTYNFTDSLSLANVAEYTLIYTFIDGDGIVQVIGTFDVNIIPLVKKCG